MAATRGNAEVAREYLRVSKDRSGEQRSPEEQHSDNQRAAKARGWVLGEPYQDTGSASRYAVKSRTDFVRLIADLEADRLGAQILILWEPSRGSRRVGEWVNLIELCERRGVSIFVTSDGKLYDPADARDRRTLLEESVDSEYEAAKTSKRTKRAHAATAAQGKPSGPCPYGYRRVYDPETKKLVAQKEEPDEAEVIRQLFKRLHGGHSLRAIARDLEAAGIRNRAGKPFRAQSLRVLALSPTYSGKRVHDTARKHGHTLSPTASYTDAIWPALVDRSVFLAVQQRLTAPERVTTRPGRGVHLLSMIAKCDACGGPLAARTHKTHGVEYQCHTKGCIRVGYDELNTIAEAAMWAYLERDDHAELFAPAQLGSELQAARDLVAEIGAELDDLADQVGRGELSATLAARAEPAILTRLHAAEARERELSTPSVLHALMKPGKDVRRRWKDAPMSTRREVARLLLAPDMLGELRVRRNPTLGVYCPVKDRVRWRIA